MLARFVALVAASAVGVTAAGDFLWHMDTEYVALGKRQSYKPPPPHTCSGPGNTCASACGAGSEWCSEPARLCFNPTLAETCCDAGSVNAWACPDGDYCLVDGYCCPKELDPKECAAKYSVTLPSTFTMPGGTGTGPTITMPTTTGGSGPGPSGPAPSGTGDSSPGSPPPTAAPGGNSTYTYTAKPQPPSTSSPPVVVAAASLNSIPVSGALCGLVALAAAMFYAQALVA